MAATETAPSTLAVVITGRGPCRCSSRPAGMPATAPARFPAEYATVTAARDHPVLAATWPASTGNA